MKTRSGEDRSESHSRTLHIQAVGQRSVTNPRKCEGLGGNLGSLIVIIGLDYR